MNVKALVELLQQFPQDLPVYCRIDDYVDEIDCGEMQIKSWSKVPILMLDSRSPAVIIDGN